MPRRRAAPARRGTGPPILVLAVPNVKRGKGLLKDVGELFIPMAQNAASTFNPTVGTAFGMAAPKALQWADDWAMSNFPKSKPKAKKGGKGTLLRGEGARAGRGIRLTRAK